MKPRVSLFFPPLWIITLSALLMPGIAEGGTFTVTNANNAGAGSLRQAIISAQAAAGPDEIRFDPLVFTGATAAANTITITAELSLSFSIDLVTIDARNLPYGVTLHGGDGTNRIFRADGAPLTLRGLTITSANGSGAIFSNSTLTLTHCTLHGNSTTDFLGGSAIVSNSGLILEHCTFFNNSSTAIFIANFGYGSMTHCTLAGEAIQNGGSLGLTNCIAGTLLNQTFLGSFGFSGVNLMYWGGLSGNPENGTTILSGDPNLAPLGYYGGPTPTRPPLPGSPAVDPPAAQTSSSLTADQRGLSRVVDGNGDAIARVDIGAYEAGNFSNYDAWSWETLPATASAAQRVQGFDFDKDGQDNYAEWLALTNPGSGSNFFAPATNMNAANLVITFPASTGRAYRLRESGSMAAGSWMDTPGQALLLGNGSPASFTVPRAGITRRFYQVVPELP